MKPRSIILCSLLPCFGFSSVGSSALAGTYALVCVTTITADAKESVLAEQSSPEPGEKLVVHLDANTKCTALIVPLEEKGLRLANGWRPQMVTLPQWNSRIAWQWDAGRAFALWIFFFKPNALGLAEIEKLVKAMQSRTLGERVLTQQTRLLCDKLSGRMRGSQQIMRGPKASVRTVGGVVIQGGFPWGTCAERVTLNDALEGTLVLHHGR
jgi:hypothetical protein